MHNKQSSVHQPDTSSAPARRFSPGKIIGRLSLALVLGLAFIGYLTPGMRIQWANLMTLCGF